MDALAHPGYDPVSTIGGRTDKGAVGHGRQIAIYCRPEPEVHFATHELGPVFSPLAGEIAAWYPDHVELVGGPGADLPGRRRIAVTADDVVVVEWTVTAEATDLELAWTVTGDGRSSKAWRGEVDPSAQTTETVGQHEVLLHDRLVYPDVLAGGLIEAFGSSTAPVARSVDEPGRYALHYEARVPAGETRRFLMAAAFATERTAAIERLAGVLSSEDPIEQNRADWRRFYQDEIPRFACSNQRWNELWAFRWFLLRLSTAGGDLGLFRYPIVLEGRDAYQTYCCFSAPFMALDLNWSVDSKQGAGHWANMAHCTYEDGRFPWYTAPNTNHVPLHHASATGASFLQHAAWQHYLIHGDLDPIREVYPAFSRNLRWWLRERDPEGTGLYRIDHLLETGMDDLARGEAPILAVDATSYLHANALALSGMARALGRAEEAIAWEAVAERSRDALRERCWDEEAQFFWDRSAKDQAPLKVMTIAGFYPFFADAAGAEQMGIFKHLFDPNRFEAPAPIPALALSEPGFDPESFWMGPSWPAATCHVLEGFARATKRYDRAQLPRAAELLERCIGVFFTPEVDFYERYQPLTGRGLSRFRDYMHSWWIDIMIRHVAGLTPREDGALEVDPLPLGLDWFALENAPYRGQRIDIVWQRPDRDPVFPERAPGLTVLIDGARVLTSLELERLVQAH